MRVHTDAGIVGLGETVDKVPGARGALHGTVAPLVLGQDPLDIEGVWRFVMDNIMYHGYAGAETRALSALEVALWDIMGKHYGAPLYHLLGGKTRERGADLQHLHRLWPRAGLCGLARRRRAPGAVAAGRRHPRHEDLAVRPLQRGHVRPVHQPCDRSKQGCSRCARFARPSGSEMEIGIECHFRWNRASMERIARALEPYDILFLEDVLPAVYPDEIKLLGQRTTIPIIGSELLMTRWQLREWLEKHVSPIVMTDPVWNGGIAETRKIAALAETFGVPLVLHNVAGPICHAACMHLGAHIPNLYFVESVRAFYQTYFPILSDSAST